MSRPALLTFNHDQTHVLRITLSNASTRNALSLDMMKALQHALDEARDNDDIRVIVLDHEGPAFSAGHNLKEIQAHRSDDDGGKAFFGTIMDACVSLMTSIVRHPKPVIAIVRGVATAAGCQLVASCDLAIATDKATFATPGVHIGLFCSTPMVALSRNVHRKQAMEMLLTGEQIDAGSAKEYGLINRIVPDDYLELVIAKYAASIAEKSPAVVAIGKEAFYAQAERSLDDAYAYTRDVMVENLMHADAVEGIDAFVGKRKPQW